MAANGFSFHADRRLAQFITKALFVGVTCRAWRKKVLVGFFPPSALHHPNIVQHTLNRKK